MHSSTRIRAQATDVARALLDAVDTGATDAAFGANGPATPHKAISLEEADVLTVAPGLVVTMTDGTQFAVTVTRIV